MKVPFVDLVSWAKPSRDEYLAAFAQVIDTGAFVGGPQVASFEKAFAAFCGAQHAVALNNGTDALLLALRALDIGPGDEVITAANSFFATAEAISHAGAKPVLVDVDDQTLLLDLDSAAKHVTPKTKAIIPVHLFGQMADMERVRAFAAKTNLKVLEDSAQAHGATRAGARAGSAGHAAAFSFYPTKNLGAIGEGGAVTTNDPAVADRVRQLRDHGQAGRHEHVAIAYNARLDSVQCACLEITLKRLPAATERRRLAAQRYRAKLMDSVRYVTEARDSAPVYHLMIVRVDAAKRDAIRDALGKAGVATAIHYPTPIHLQPAYASLGQGVGTCPVAEKSVREMISLPMFPDITDAQIDYVAAELLKALA
jgi:dTDP-4-amino-4,6-dideoxygalactose transaminase